MSATLVGIAARRPSVSARVFRWLEWFEKEWITEVELSRLLARYVDGHQPGAAS